MFPYWFMTAFSIIRMDWQVDSVCPDLPILLMAFDTYSALMDVWSIASIFPIWCPHRQRSVAVLHHGISPRLRARCQGLNFLDWIWRIMRKHLLERGGIRQAVSEVLPTPPSDIPVREYQSYRAVSLEADIPWGHLKMAQKHSGKLGQDPWPGEEASMSKSQRHRCMKMLWLSPPFCILSHLKLWRSKHLF